MKLEMTIKYLKFIGTIVTKLDLILFGKWIVFIYNIIINNISINNIMARFNLHYICHFIILHFIAISPSLSWPVAFLFVYIRLHFDVLSLLIFRKGNDFHSFTTINLNLILYHLLSLIIRRRQLRFFLMFHNINLFFTINWTNKVVNKSAT